MTTYIYCKWVGSSASLGIIPVPSLTEINASPEFQARQITQAEFEQQWQSATGKR